MLQGALEEICGQEATREIMKMVNGAVEAIAEMRAQAGAEEPPALLPRTA